MQFLRPEFLYALFLLLIPILIHLFQLRRFEKVPFTNVEFLKKVDLQTRKSQTLKKWLVLLTRLFLLAAVILAFAQPYTSQTNKTNAETETVIYLDNSFSMQAKGAKGELLKRAVQDIITTTDDGQNISVFTNDNTFRNTTVKAIRNDLLQLDYSGTQLDYNAALLKGIQLFNTQRNTVKNLIVISDFQQNKPLNLTLIDSTVTTHLVKVNPVNTNNVSIDSAYISKQNIDNIDLSVVINKHDGDLDNLPVSLFNDGELVTKTSVNFDNGSTAVFTLPSNTQFNGKLQIEDLNLQFDNDLFFTINEHPKINVLSITNTDDNYFRRVYTEDEFNYTSVELDQLNYDTINDQNLIILNELKAIPVALVNALTTFVSNNSNLLVIPSNECDLMSYNALFTALNASLFSEELVLEKRITNINFDHPLYANVFDNEVTNFQYPKVNTYFENITPSIDLLSFEDDKPFLTQTDNTFVFNAAINEDNSNFTNSPLIVPTLYNIGRQSLKTSDLYFNIGQSNTFEVPIVLQQDDILKMKFDQQEIIPQQRTFSDKVEITTQEVPEIAGNYTITSNNESLETIAYNYNRSESNLVYHGLENLDAFTISSSVPDVINEIKSATNINALWKWFVIFALIFLIIEMLILRFFK